MRKRPAKLTMDGQFESRFKNYDESEMNQPLSQWAFSGRCCLENPTTAVYAKRFPCTVGVEYLSFITKPFDTRHGLGPLRVQKRIT